MPPREVLACRGYGVVKACLLALAKRLSPANTKAPALIAEALVLFVVLGVGGRVGVSEQWRKFCTIQETARQVKPWLR